MCISATFYGSAVVCEFYWMSVDQSHKTLNPMSNCKARMAGRARLARFATSRHEERSWRWGLWSESLSRSAAPRESFLQLLHLHICIQAKCSQSRWDWNTPPHVKSEGGVAWSWVVWSDYMELHPLSAPIRVLVQLMWFSPISEWAASVVAIATLLGVRLLLWKNRAADFIGFMHVMALMVQVILNEASTLEGDWLSRWYCPTGLARFLMLLNKLVPLGMRVLIFFNWAGSIEGLNK